MRKNKTVADYPEIAAQWHPTKNGSLIPSMFLHGSNKIMWWRCSVSDDHEWEARISSRIMDGHGCSCCHNRKVVKSNCLATTHPRIAAQWHPTKNGDLTPNDVVFGSHNKVWWKCSVAADHEWESTVNNRTNGEEQCPCCIGQKVVKSNCLATIHPELAKQWHPTKNKLTPSDVTAFSNKKVWWKCFVAEDHEWEASVNNRNGKGRECPCCSNHKVVKSNCLATIHPELAVEWHPTKNVNLTPNDVAGGYKKVWWKCVKGHEWMAAIRDRIRGTGCPSCRQSRGERMIARILKNNNIIFRGQYKFPTCKDKLPLPFDFVLMGRDGVLKIIEYQGKQHYVPVSFGSKKLDARKHLKQIQRHDAIKANWCRKHKIPFLTIPYNEDINKLLFDFLK